METWFLILISLLLALLLKPLFVNLFFPSKLPPGPTVIPIITPIIWLSKSPTQIEAIIKNLQSKYGPLVSLQIGPRPAIFISDRSVAHKALVQNGAIFADRPTVRETNRILSSNQHTINSAPYGHTWRLLRRNLTAEILHPSRVRSYTHARKWVLDILLTRLKSHSHKHGPVSVIDNFQYAMFCLLVLMCFGDKLGDEQIKEIEEVQRRVLLNSGSFNILNFWPRLTKIIFQNRWEKLFRLKNDQIRVLDHLIEARKKLKKEKSDIKEEFVLSYVDTLLDLELPDEKRKLNKDEMVSLCSEFLNAGTDTTSTALQWIMANLVKYPEIQNRVLEEIREVLGEGEKEVKEEDLGKLPYLKAVVLEGLRRHPPGHFVLPHAVTEDVVLEGYVIPKKGSVNFMVAEMGWDPKVWEDPMAFNPERFLCSDGGEVVDITGSKEIKMMPFGVGRRICPGHGLAMLHLEYFVANLVWNFEWKSGDGVEVDLSEKVEFTVVMKNPLRAYIRPRF